jgi:hypothetical protein
MKNDKLCGMKGFDPDNPAVAAAIDMVRWELSLQREPDRCPRNFPPVTP